MSVTIPPQNYDPALLDTLPKNDMWDIVPIYQYEGFWLEKTLLDGTMAFRSRFEARDDDVILASPPKTGTTWLKALTACMKNLHQSRQTAAHTSSNNDIIDDNNKDEDENEDFLMKQNPHDIVRTFEADIYYGTTDPNKPQQILSTMTSPRLFHTHLPYALLPPSVHNSKCKIVYIMRNPKDYLISNWHFMNSNFSSYLPEPYPLEKAVKKFCQGVTLYGPYFDHVLGYWNKSCEDGNKVLFLRYEDMKNDPVVEMKKLGLFLEWPFASDEEIGNVLERCSLERLKGLEVNKSGVSPFGLPNCNFFRRGVVGDWKNYFTSDMDEMLSKYTRAKLEGTSLEIKM